MDIECEIDKEVA